MARLLRYFYPRPPRGGRPHAAQFYPECCCISIHVLREEDDLFMSSSMYIFKIISIHVLREEDDLMLSFGVNLPEVISIHVLREEDDVATPR